MQESIDSPTGLTRPLAWIYIGIGAAWAVGIVLGATRGITDLDLTFSIIPAIYFAVGVGVLRRTVWGRWLGYFLSAVMLFGIPIGTLLGGFMIWHLTRYRSAFRRWY